MAEGDIVLNQRERDTGVFDEELGRIGYEVSRPGMMSGELFVDNPADAVAKAYEHAKLVDKGHVVRVFCGNADLYIRVIDEFKAFRKKRPIFWLRLDYEYRENNGVLCHSFCMSRNRSISFVSKPLGVWLLPWSRDAIASATK